VRETARTTARLVALAAAAVAWMAAAASPAAAVTGQLAYAGCLGNVAAQGCIDLPEAPLQGADGVAVSPDGASLYVASNGSDSVTHLFRGADGRLALDGCLNNDGTENCGDLPAAPLDGPSGVAVSPDGRSVYVVTYQGGSIAHFFRDLPGGQLYYDGCLNNDGTQGCVDLPGAPLSGADGVAVSPDGGSVYVAAFGSGAVARFNRLQPGGQIVYDGCLNNDGSDSCTDLPDAPIAGPSAVAVSPDSTSVYVASFSGDSIGYLRRDTATGKLAWDGCLNDDGSQGCANVPGAPLDGANGVAVSPDGRSVYVASSIGDSVTHLGRDTATGTLAFAGCLDNDGALGCDDAPGAPLDKAFGVVVSPDGASVYVASNGSDSVAHLLRGAGGRLAWERCVSNDGTEGCDDAPGAPLDGATAVAVSPDATSVYVAAVDGNTVAHFARALAAPAPPAPPGQGAGGGSSAPPAPAPRSAFGAAVRVTARLAAGRIGAKGPVRVVIANANAFAVTGTLAGRTARAVVATRRPVALTGQRFAVAAAGRTTVRLTLSQRLRRELARKRRLVLRLTLGVRDPAGNRRTVRTQVVPRLAAPRRAAKGRAR
jgi:DNA-binding beta-propeller fold protein YncE